MKNFKNILGIILFLFALISCSNNVNEPVRIEAYDYELSKADAQLQANILLEETVTIVLESLEKRNKSTKTEFEVIKKKSTQNNYFSNGWYVWQDNIRSAPFGENNSYTASYISKLFFNNPQPNIADTTKSKFNVHTKFGFQNNSIYGDEVDFSINTLLLKSGSSKNSTNISVSAKYNRHWVANYDGNDSDLKYNIYIDSRNLEYFSSSNSDWFEGHLEIASNNFFIDAQFSKSNEVLINFFKGNNLIKNYTVKLNSLQINKNLQKKSTNIFPGFSAVNDNFINLLSNFPNKNKEELSPNF